jgi:ribosome-binding factor A
MPREFTRSERVSDALQREIASLIRENVRDPRVGMLSVTDVTVSRDLSVAKVYVAFVGERSAEQIKEGLSALNGACRLFFANYCLQVLRYAQLPALNFFYDETGQRSQHLDALIDLAIASDSGNQEES